MTNGYIFYFDDGSDLLTFPITPGALSIKVGSNNKVITMINEGDINILKSPSLVEVSFEARFPMRKYPYSREVSDFQTYFDKFKELKEKKKSFRFKVVRATPSAKRLWDTDLLVALEDFTITEDANEGDDVLIEFKLKQYKEYGVKILPNSTEKTTTSTSEQPRSSNNAPTEPKPYTIKSGDCLWNIAKAAYGDGSKWRAIYDANKTVLDNAARQYGKSSSSNGKLIYPGTVITIPDVDAANLTVQRLNNKSSTATSGGRVINIATTTNQLM